MKVLWISINTTSIEPTVANVIELSAALQVDGDIVNKLDSRLEPIFLKDDQLFGGRESGEFLAAYQKWIKSSDPMHILEAWDAGNALNFFYNPGTLKYLGIQPEDLIDCRQEARHVLSMLVDMLAAIEGRKWILAGHNVSFVAEVLQGWAKRCDKKLYERLLDLVEFKKSIDTIPFFKVVATFQPHIARKGFGLKELAGELGGSVKMDTKSKLDGLLEVCGKVLSGRSVLNEPGESIPS